MEGLGLALRGSFIKVKSMASMCLACSRVLMTYFKQVSYCDKAIHELG